MTPIRLSLFLSLADNYAGVALGLISTLIISRLLTPEEIGIFGVAAVLASLASMFRDFGVGEYLIQAKELTAEKIRACFAINLIVSWLMAALLFFTSNLAGEFFRQPGVAVVVKIQSINFLLIPFGAVAMAYFRRELNYRPIMIANVIGNTMSFAVSTVSALQGFGYVSLAFGSVTGVVCTVAVSLALRPKDFPRWPSFTGAMDVVHFGKHATGIYLLNHVGKYSPDVVIGRVIDVTSVAIFSRANGLLEVFNRAFLQAVMPMCLPYFSKAIRSGDDIRFAYLKSVTLLTGIGWPFILLVCVIAFSAIRMLYGPQWPASVPIARILCVAALIELPYILVSELMIANGRVDLSHRLQLYILCMRLGSLVGVFHFGLTGVGWGWALAALGAAAAGHRLLHCEIGIRLSDLARATLPSAAVTVLALAPALIIVTVAGQNEDNYLAVFGSCSAATGVSWLLAVRLCKHPCWTEVSSLLSRRAKGKQPPTGAASS